MKQLSSHLSKPRRRVYGLLTTGLLSAGVAAGVGGLIFGLGRSRGDITMPFWECGEYVLLLGLLNLGLYGALFWQVSRLSRRARRPATEHPSVLLAPLREEAPADAPPVDAGGQGVRPQPPGAPRQVSRRIRGTPASLNLDP